MIINLKVIQTAMRGPLSYSTVNDTIDGETDDDVFSDASSPQTDYQSDQQLARPNP